MYSEKDQRKINVLKCIGERLDDPYADLSAILANMLSKPEKYFGAQEDALDASEKILSGDEGAIRNVSNRLHSYGLEVSYIGLKSLISRAIKQAEERGVIETAGKIGLAEFMLNSHLNTLYPEQTNTYNAIVMAANGGANSREIMELAELALDDLTRISGTGGQIHNEACNDRYGLWMSSLKFTPGQNIKISSDTKTGKKNRGTDQDPAYV